MKAPSLTLGVEEEYQIIDPETRELRSYITEILKEDHLVLQEVKPELHQSMVEVGSKVCETPADVRAELVRLRGMVMQLAGRSGLKIAAAGTHPFSCWTKQEITPLERYIGVRQDLAELAQQLLIFGTHVHVGVEDKDFGGVQFPSKIEQSAGGFPSVDLTVTGGAVGNLIDRVRSPLGVVDFLDVGFGTVRWPVFNVADIAVTVGAVLRASSCASRTCGTACASRTRTHSPLCTSHQRRLPSPPPLSSTDVFGLQASAYTIVPTIPCAAEVSTPPSDSQWLQRDFAP